MERKQIRLDDQSVKDADLVQQRYSLRSRSAAIRYALREIARGLQGRKGRTVKRLTIQPMSAKELWTELETLLIERPDFDTLDVYVDVVTRQSYEKEKAWDGEGEFTETYITEGSAFSLVVPTGYDMSGDKPQEIGDYVLIRSVELDS